MKFVFAHNNINVLDLDKSVEFYKKALGYVEVSRKHSQDESFILAFLSDENMDYKLELTWLRDKHEPYNLGDNEIHMAAITDDYEGAHAYHKKMGCICYENEGMGLYFIADPDGYWTEIIPKR